MIIDKIRSSDADGCSNVECEVTMETHNGGSQHIFARTEPPHTLEADPNAFLLGAFLPAWAAGESRINIEGAVCPLLANLTIAASTLGSWFTDLRAPPTIECDYEYRPPATRSAAFLSGGVDSLEMIRSLTARRPPGHPDRPSAAIVVDYQYVGGLERSQTDARFARSLSASHRTFWVASSVSVPLPHRTATHLVPWGSHPQLDPFYSSQHVRISHESVELSRLQKVETLRDWPAALDRMYVCTSNLSQGANCGSCEKCLRTRVHMLVAGMLADAGAFGLMRQPGRPLPAMGVAVAYRPDCKLEEHYTMIWNDSARLERLV